MFTDEKIKIGVKFVRTKKSEGAGLSRQRDWYLSRHMRWLSQEMFTDENGEVLSLVKVGKGKVEEMKPDGHGSSP